MAEVSREVIVMVESEKDRPQDPQSRAALVGIHTLVTDEGLASAAREQIQARGSR